MSERWLVVQTQPRREQWACENISRLKFEYYFPKVYVKSTPRAGLSVARAEPLFPRHLFIRSDEGQWRSLTGCWGVAGVIMFGESPGVIPNKEIARLRSREDSDGMITLPDRGLLPGDKVRVVGGAFNGWNGIYQGDIARDRIKILLDVLGKKTAVLLSDKHVEPV